MNKIKTVVFFAVFFFIISSKVIGQNPVMLPNLGINDNGFGGGMVEFQDSLYFLYSSSFAELAKFNGINFRRLRGQTLFSQGVRPYPLIYNNRLYYRFLTYGVYKLGRINADTSVTIFDNPDVAATILADSLSIEFNGKLYFIIGIAGKYRLAEFDGNNVAWVPQPDGGDGFTTYKPVVNNGYLYWVYQNINHKFQVAKYDGSTISLIGDPGSGTGAYSNIVQYNNDIYFKFNNKLARYNEVNNIITYITGSDAIGSDPFIFDNKIWFKISNGSIQQYSLAYYNGNNINIIGQPLNFDFGFSKPIIFNSKLYFCFDSSTVKH